MFKIIPERQENLKNTMVRGAKQILCITDSLHHRLYQKRFLKLIVNHSQIEAFPKFDKDGYMTHRYLNIVGSEINI